MDKSAPVGLMAWMACFLERQSSELIQGGVDNMNYLLKEIQSVLHNLLNKKASGPNGVTGELH